MKLAFTADSSVAFLESPRARRSTVQHIMSHTHYDIKLYSMLGYTDTKRVFLTDTRLQANGD